MSLLGGVERRVVGRSGEKRERDEVRLRIERERGNKEGIKKDKDK